MSVIVIISAIFAVLIASVYLFVKHQFSYWKRRGVPFARPSFPFGNFTQTFLRKQTFGDVLQDLYNSTTEPVLGTFTLLRPILLIRDPKIIYKILIKDFQYFYNRGFHQNEDIDPLGGNMFFQNDDKWKKMRNALSPTFTSGKIKGMFEIIMNCGDSLEKYLNTFAESGEEFDTREIFARYTTNTIAAIAFGIDIDCIKNPDNEFRKYGSKHFEPTLINGLRSNMSFMSPTLSKLFKCRFVDKEVADFMTETVRQNLEYREQNNVIRKDFFQLLIQLRNSGKIQEDDNWTTSTENNEKLLTLDEMTAQAFVFFIAGFETTSSTMSFCLYELAKNPEIQQKAYEDIIYALEKHDGKLTYESVGEMKYLDKCIDETLRIQPAVDILFRMCTKDYKLPDHDIVIEKGTSIILSMSGLHYDPTYYEEPERFNPDRFDADQIARKKFEEMPYLPFGEGPKNCIGKRLGKLKAKIGICLILQKFAVELGAQHSKDEKLVMDPNLTLIRSPISGIHLKIKPR